MVELQQLYFNVTNSNLKSFDHGPVGPLIKNLYFCSPAVDQPTNEEIALS